MTEMEKLAGQIVESCKNFMKRATADIGKRVDELEHRGTRHSEHIARLETRLAALERKADK